MVSKFLALLAGVVCVDGARVGRKRAEVPGTKFLAGTPILNYHLAYGGSASAAEIESGKLQGDWLVVVNKHTSNSKVLALCKLAKCKAVGHPETGVPMFEVEGTEDDLKRVIEAGKGEVQFAEPNSAVRMIDEIPADVQASRSWGLDRVAAPLRGSEGSGVHIYILDTGVRRTHTDFGGRVVPTLDMTGEVLRECGEDLSCAADTEGHGTHCAGTAAGETFGIAPAAVIHSVKVLSDEGKGSWGWSIGALDWLATTGERPAVASMSLGGSGTQNTMKVAVDGAVAAGVTVVVAGGNSNANACYYSPAFIPSAITVGSTTSKDARSSFSNYGSCTDIWAPGSDITSAAHDSDTGSATFSGTSMACPHVSGASALVLSANPSLQAGDGVLAELKANAALNAISSLKYGDVNFLLYVGEGGAPPTPPTPAPWTPRCHDKNSYGPDTVGDCRCNSGTYCYSKGNYGCPYSSTASSGRKSGRYYVNTCGPDCYCKVR